MQVYIAQLRELVGIKRPWNPDFNGLGYQVVVEGSRSGVGLLEMDTLVRTLIQENLENAERTLVSLVTLIDEIEGMTVKKHILELVSESIKSINTAFKCTEKLDYDGALEASILAVTRAESAFFDESLVSLLYFPSEHKYAVYMPFFVPFCVPILTQLFKFLKGKYE